MALVLAGLVVGGECVQLLPALPSGAVPVCGHGFAPGLGGLLIMNAAPIAAAASPAGNGA